MFGGGKYDEKTVEEVCDSILGGGTPSKSKPEYYTGEIPWVTPKDMKSAIITDSIDHITEEAVNVSTVKMVPQKSILMVIRSGILKHDLPLAINAVPVTINQDMKAFIVGNEITPEYLMYSFVVREAELLSNVRAVTADNIEFGVIKNMCIPIPPLDLQTRFSDFVRQTDKSKF
ncbi:MAG: restriction endonuclease subunit S [Peptococcaceae bacterium]|jgi:type I restriction enzyme S subunit|nr:restriction endonuclease subunit S [Peptococcaceae bacterium]